MDNTFFRSALNGFNRQDVMTYIEKTRSDAETRTARLEDRVRELQETCESQRQALETAGSEREELARRLEETELGRSHAQNNWDAQRQATEALRDDVSARDASIGDLTAEKERLARRVLELEEEVASLRRDKEQVAQLELEARQRAADTVEESRRQAADIQARAQAEADDLMGRARAEAESLRAQAKTETDALRQETEEHLTSVVEQYSGLFSSFESISAHVSAELRKMDVSVTQLPLSFNHLREGLQAVLDKAKE